MKKIFVALILLMIVAGVIYATFLRGPEEFNVLVFSKTEGFRHESIDAGHQAIKNLGEKYGFKVDTTEDASIFKEKNLRKYKVVIFLNTTGDVLNEDQQLEFNRFIQAGGGFVGIHSASDTEYNWPWYGKLVGAYFKSHPNDPHIQEATLNVMSPDHPATENLPEKWVRSDEWYNLRDISEDINVLVKIDESTYIGGENGEDHPMSWYHEYDGGRAFYTALGHTVESYSEALFLEHFWGGIDYAAGDRKPVNFNKSSVAPEENRFTKMVLEEALNEPMELDVLPDRKIIFIERKGDIKLYDPDKDTTVIINHINVHTKHEDGLLGMALDPDFINNQWIYLFYSPDIEKSIQHVSRFDFKEDSLDLTSEKVLLKIPVQRDECCHSAGSLEFGPDGNLFISVGDNTNPFDSDGFAPIDEREGRAPWDAQKSSANTNDLRGKILRIKPESDGTYSIPEGNLFASDGSQGRPEIYVMGCRNPFRFFIDSKTKFLYWGDVGPDAGEDSTGRGPRGYDEINQAREAGFFGWPYFIADNKAYNDYNFSNQSSGKKFNPKKPVNLSPNNTGMEKLPPARDALIWYPYNASEEFPLVGTGGRNAMAGQVFYTSEYPENSNRYPEYFEGKIFTYDWMRGWIMVVTLDDEGNFLKMERFLPNLTLVHPIDMIFGPDGDLFLLEYGSLWFSQNQDARLVHLKYNPGNRKPIAKINIENSIGKTPLVTVMSGEGSFDFEDEDLKFQWSIQGQDIISEEKNTSFTFEDPGVYNIKLIVKDTDGLADSTKAMVIAGNDLPEVKWEIAGNTDFYWDDTFVEYKVFVSDTEDGTIESEIETNSVVITADYLQNPEIEKEGHKNVLDAVGYLVGRQLIEQSDCKACHQVETKSVGPSYREISKRYLSNPDAVKYLSEKIIKGGGGVWGEQNMNPHPQLTVNETRKMVNYILSLEDESIINSLPASGNLKLDKHRGNDSRGKYILTASYTDSGAPGVPSLTGRDMVVLKNPKLEGESFDESNDIMTYEVKKGDFPLVDEDFTVIVGTPGKYFAFNSVDMTGIKSVTARIALASGYTTGGVLEIRKDSKQGEIIGEIILEQGITDFGMDDYYVELPDLKGKQNLYFIFRSEDNDPSTTVAALDWIYFSNRKEKPIL